MLRPVAGQCFEIDIAHQGGQWVIRIPEINDATEAPTRAAVELAARECIAARTGIPIGYISVWVRD
ncbi:MAG: long chain fatty acid-CoA synthetase Faa4p [Mycobacterium sp.]|nr:long chain fatty acid-CoA synthetase Faa4p [Mycobacterium sp.]